MEQVQSDDYSRVRQRTVVFDHDGNPDDIVSLMLILGMPNINLIGVTVTPADCYIDDAIDLTLKIINIYGKSIPIAQGNIESPNPFPDEYRLVTIKSNHIPILINQEMDRSLLSKKPAHEFLVDVIKNSKEKVTVMMTGPATNLTAAFEIDPTIKNNIEEVVWMAGAVDVGGNVWKFDHDKTAEWNVYWDAEAARKLFATGLVITIFPLDATNQVPVDLNFLKRLAKGKQYTATDIVGQFYAVTFMSSKSGLDEYFMWDTLSCSYLGCEGFAQFRKVELDVVTDRPSLGRTIKKPGNGQWIRVAEKINKEKFFQYYIDTLKVNGKLKQAKA